MSVHDRPSRIRRGKLRTCLEGYSINVFLGDETKLCTVYGGSPSEVEERMRVAISAFDNTYKSY